MTWIEHFRDTLPEGGPMLIVSIVCVLVFVVGAWLAENL